MFQIISLFFYLLFFLQGFAFLIFFLPQFRSVWLRHCPSTSIAQPSSVSISVSQFVTLIFLKKNFRTPLYFPWIYRLQMNEVYVILCTDIVLHTATFSIYVWFATIINHVSNTFRNNLWKLWHLAALSTYDYKMCIRTFGRILIIICWMVKNFKYLLRMTFTAVDYILAL